MTAQLNARGDVAVLVPAAGAGLRLGPGGPKALRLLAGEPLLVHAVRRVAAAPSVRLIVIAAPAADVEAVRALLAPVARVVVVAGGAERQESVALALAMVPAEIDIVLVHDAARALTPPELVESVAAAVRRGLPAVIPVLPVVDTIKEVTPATGAGSGEVVRGTVDRSVLRSVQTPQGFRHAVLAAAHAAAAPTLAAIGAPAGGPTRASSSPGPGSDGASAPAAEQSISASSVGGIAGTGKPGAATDDAGLVEMAGVAVTCVAGSELAMKITRPLDLILAEALLHVP